MTITKRDREIVGAIQHVNYIDRNSRSNTLVDYIERHRNIRRTQHANYIDRLRNIRSNIARRFMIGK